jgi:hypothetical protein
MESTWKSWLVEGTRLQAGGSRAGRSGGSGGANQIVKNIMFGSAPPAELAAALEVDCQATGRWRRENLRRHPRWY